MTILSNVVNVLLTSIPRIPFGFSPKWTVNIIIIFLQRCWYLASMWSWPVPTQRKEQTKIWSFRVCGFGVVFCLFFKGKTTLALLNWWYFWVVFMTLIGQFCLCSKCSRVKTGMKGCLPEETCQNKKICKSSMALNSHGHVLVRLLSYLCCCNSNGWIYLARVGWRDNS